MTRENCDRLGAYRMPMGWIAIELETIVENAKTLQTSAALTDSVIKVSAGNVLLNLVLILLTFELSIFNNCLLYLYNCIFCNYLFILFFKCYFMLLNFKESWFNLCF